MLRILVVAVFLGLVAFSAGWATSPRDVVGLRSSAGLIAFERSAKDGSGGIWLMSSDGTRQRRLTIGCCFDWSPDGTKIAFLRGDGVYVIGVDGSGLRRLRADGTQLDWSPDGRKIAFKGDHHDIYVMNADGTDTRQLTHSGADRAHFSPHWSPDGARIAFDALIEEPLKIYEELFVMNPNGSGQRRVTYNESDMDEASWAPDSRHLVFRGWDRSYGIFVIGVNGSGQRRLSNGGEEPTWSPDGRAIAFVRGRSRTAIHVANADSGRQRRLRRTNSKSIERHPAWSPDGGKLAFAVFDFADRNFEIGVVNSNGSGELRLTRREKGVNDTAPAWSPSLG